MGALSNFFGYILNFIYNFIPNYGLAIIIFSILIKIVLLPLSLKQQKTAIKTANIQGKVKEIQNKYKNDQNKMNQELMDLYKRENMNPLSGCLSTIIQIVLLFAIFGLVRNPLTYMKKIDNETIEKYKAEVVEQIGEQGISSAYPQISILKYVNNNKGQEDPLYINMNFLGLDLSKIPQENLKDLTVYIIPLLYVITSILSMKLTTMATNKKEKDKEDIIIEKEKTEENKKEEKELDMTTQMNKSMSWFMPIMSVSIAIIAPLGLALYWLINNILMIAERLILGKFMKAKKEA